MLGDIVATRKGPCLLRSQVRFTPSQRAKHKNSHATITYHTLSSSTGAVKPSRRLHQRDIRATGCLLLLPYYHLFAMVETLPRAAPARASPARSCPPPVHCTFLASISFPAAWRAAIVGRGCCVEASHQHALAAALCCPRLQPSSVPAPGMPPATAAHS